MFSYVEENGRTYHAFNEGSKSRDVLHPDHPTPYRLLLPLLTWPLEYVLPNDEEEQERLGMRGNNVPTSLS